MPDIWMDVDTALSEVPVNITPLIDNTDFKTIEDAVAYNAAGMALYWHFVTTGGAYTVTAVTPTTAGNYDWTDQGAAGIYTIEIPASGGASINNDTEGFGWFTGVCTGVLPWRGPVIGFRAAALNDALIDSAWSTTRGLAGTALPNAAADAAGGLIVSDAGGLDADAQRSDVAAILVDTGTTLDGRIPAALGANGNMKADLRDLNASNQSLLDLKDFADTGYNPVTHYIAGIEGTLNQFDDLNNAVTAPTAIQNRQEMDTNSTQLAAIVDDTGTSGVVLANDAITAAKIAANAIGASELAADAAQEIADALLDRASAIEGYTLREAQRLILSALVAKLSGAATTTVAIRNVADTKDRVTATVDADGNRTAITLDAT